MKGLHHLMNIQECLCILVARCASCNCMTYFNCVPLQVYTPFRSAQNHCPPDNVRLPEAISYDVLHSIEKMITSAIVTTAIITMSQTAKPNRCQPVFLFFSNGKTSCMFPTSTHSSIKVPQMIIIPIHKYGWHSYYPENNFCIHPNPKHV